MTHVASQRLTDFQLLMRDWRHLAPYNFIHAMRLPGAPDPGRWENAIRDALRELGIHDGAPIEHKVDLDAHLESELQRAFTSPELPLRFFVVNESTDAYWFGVTLDHWFADDFSSRLLLQRIHSIYHGTESASLYRTGPLPRRCSLWCEWRGFVRESARMHRACRVTHRDPLNFDVGVFRVALPADALAACRGAAKENEATLHDLLLAVTAQALGSSALANVQAPRDSVAVVSVMDFRRFEREPNRSGFGLVLGHYRIMERRPDQVSLEELVRRIAAKTRPLKTSPQCDLVRPTRLMWKFNISRRAKATFFIRGTPMVAGLSNVNLTGSWIEQADITDFRRVGPTGPVVPLVVVVTTLRGRIYFDVTFRKTALSRTEAEGLVGDIVRRLPGGKG